MHWHSILLFGSPSSGKGDRQLRPNEVILIQIGINRGGRRQSYLAGIVA
ncbi:MAG: hypothetical protein NTZ01_08000 [Verrucomicrobia bacterium]|nr:hypothetical protein [Verrucomicrobiota bacterium]